MATAERSRPLQRTTGKRRLPPLSGKNLTILPKPLESGKGSERVGCSAKAKDDAEIGVKVKALGDACGSCHKAFRAEKYAE
jgi:hypothetical protein